MNKENLIVIILALFFISLSFIRFVPAIENICDKTILINNYTMRYCP